MPSSYFIRADGDVEGPLSEYEVVSRISRGDLEPWHEVAEMDLGIKPQRNHFRPVNTTPLWSHWSDSPNGHHARRQAEEEALDAIILTTETVTALPIAERLGIVSAEAVMGMNLLRDFAAGVTDIVGGRSASTQNVLREARETALDELRREALNLGADAVVAVDLDYTEFSGGRKSMLICIASGTAVRLAQEV